MTTFFQLVVVGISTGSVFAIVGMSLVLVYRATGIVNFAQGVFAVLAGLLTYSLGKHMSLPLAAVLATLVTAVVATLVAVVAVGIRGRTTHLASLIITVGIAILRARRCCSRRSGRFRARTPRSRIAPGTSVACSSSRSTRC